MEVKIKKVHKDAVTPFKTYEKDFCYDVVAVTEEEVAPNVWKYGLGFALQIERNSNMQELTLRNWYDAKNKIHFNHVHSIKGSDTNLILSLDFRPRSSVWKTGMVLSNCEGTIDELYNGEISAVFYHVMKDMPRYKVGDRIGQIKIGATFPITFKEVDELTETERGSGSYGSTGR